MKKVFSVDKLIEKIFEVSNLAIGEKVVVHEPYFKNTNALNYVSQCINSGWVSTAGEWVNKFENQICDYTGSKFAVAVSNGTVALRLALLVSGVKNEEEVIIPPLSFVATANAVSHLGAIPHFVDIEPHSLGLCPFALQKRLEEIAEKKNGKVFNKHTGKRIAAVIPVHVFGSPAKISEIKKICNIWEIPLVEDAAEALGSWVKFKKSLKHCGTFGDVSIISFNGNKIISTGGGGVLITDNSLLAKKARHLSTTAKAPHPWAFEHDEIGWNDRLPNVNAAIGSSQMEVLEERLKLKRKLYKKYCQILNCFEGLEVIKENSNCINNNWLVSIRLTINNQNELKEIRDKILNIAHSKNLFLRPSWNLINSFKMYKDAPAGDLKIAQDQSFRIINLPSSPQLLIK